MSRTAPQHIVVIGAGIVGASLAYHLAGKGAKVTVVGQLETQVPGLTLRWHGALSYGTQDGRVSPESILINRSRSARPARSGKNLRAPTPSRRHTPASACAPCPLTACPSSATCRK